DAAADGGELLFGPAGDVLAGDPDLALVGLEKAEDVFEGHRFAHAAASQDDAGLPGVHVEADVAEDHMVVEGLGDVAEFEEVVGHGCHSRSVIASEGKKQVPRYARDDRQASSPANSATAHSLPVARSPERSQEWLRQGSAG